jgi:hypothetical protein
MVALLIQMSKALMVNMDNEFRLQQIVSPLSTAIRSAKYSFS